MKSGKKIDEFWAWFRGIAKQLESDDENAILVTELDKRMRLLAPGLSWEIGPGLLSPMQFVVSPELDRDRREQARAIIKRAPVLTGWEFHSARQPKSWDYSIELYTGGRVVRLNASGWTFVLLRYPDNAYEILIRGDNIDFLNDDERVEVATILLESILGEDALLDRIHEFDLVNQLEPRFAAKQRSIRELREAVLGS